MSFGENLKRLRRDKGLTQVDLADKAGLKPSHIPKLESSSGDPKLSTIYKLINALGCNADSLITDSSQMDTNQLVKVMMERVCNLPEVNKNVLLHLIDQYCIAAGIEQTFNTSNKKWFELTYMTTSTEGMVKAPEIKP